MDTYFNDSEFTPDTHFAYYHAADSCSEIVEKDDKSTRPEEQKKK
jgi:hypothetical protein